MSEAESAYATTPIEPADARSGFSCGKHALDDYFARHAVTNDAAGIGRAYVLRRGPDDPATLPLVLGFYTLSMAVAESMHIAQVLEKRLPKYPMPVALIGRLAIDQRAHGRRLGEKLLMDALHRVVDAASILGCLGIIVDAKRRTRPPSTSTRSTTSPRSRMTAGRSACFCRSVRRVLRSRRAESRCLQARIAEYCRRRL